MLKGYEGRISKGKRDVHSWTIRGLCYLLYTMDVLYICAIVDTPEQKWMDALWYLNIIIERSDLVSRRIILAVALLLFVRSHLHTRLLLYSFSIFHILAFNWKLCVDVWMCVWAKRQPTCDGVNIVHIFSYNSSLYYQISFPNVFILYLLLSNFISFYFYGAPENFHS